MDIIFKNHSQISQLISENKGTLSETELAALVNHYADTEFASEIAVEQLMWQAKPKAMLDEWLVQQYGSIEQVYENLPQIAELLRVHRGK